MRRLTRQPQPEHPTTSNRPTPGGGRGPNRNFVNTHQESTYIHRLLLWPDARLDAAGLVACNGAIAGVMKSESSDARSENPPA